MNRHELLRQLVLVEIADDYEEPSHVYENVAQGAQACGLETTRPEVYRLLIVLTEEGLAKVYDLAKLGPEEEPKNPPALEEIEGTISGSPKAAGAPTWTFARANNGHSMTKVIWPGGGTHLSTERCVAERVFTMDLPSGDWGCDS